MSILEILEDHHEWDVDIDYDGSQDAVTCPCGWRELLGLHAGAQHRAHVAQVLEQHVLEAKAEVLTNAAAEYERLCRIGDTPQGQVTDEEKQEFWIWHAKTTDEWLRDRAAQLKETP